MWAGLFGLRVTPSSPLWAAGAVAALGIAKLAWVCRSSRSVPGPPGGNATSSSSVSSSEDRGRYSLAQLIRKPCIRSGTSSNSSSGPQYVIGAGSERTPIAQ